MMGHPLFNPVFYAGFRFDYDKNGNMIDGVSSTLVYNWDNKLRSAAKGADTISLKYDPLGNRIWKQVNDGQTTTRKYIVDIVGDLPVILMEIEPGADESFGTEDDSIAKTYIYANSQILAQHDGGHTTDRYFYLHDRLGSVRQIIKYTSSVELVSHYTYNPFGELFPTEFSEGVSNPFKFTGQYYDSEIDQYYLRARMYDPHLYRFISRDIIDGKFERPLTLHKYLYCINDPVNGIDPTGLRVFYFVGGSMVSLGYSLAAQTGVVWDDEGNWGIIGIAQEGVGWPSASVGFSFGITDKGAETIMDLEGAGWALGVGGGLGFAGAGVEFIWGSAEEGKKGYKGIEVTISGGADLLNVEGHLHRTHTYIHPVHSETLTFEDIIGIPAGEAYWQSETYGEYRFMLQFMMMTGVDLDVLMF